LDFHRRESVIPILRQGDRHTSFPLPLIEADIVHQSCTLDADYAAAVTMIAARLHRVSVREPWLRILLDQLQEAAHHLESFASIRALPSIQFPFETVEPADVPSLCRRLTAQVLGDHLFYQGRDGKSILMVQPTYSQGSLVPTYHMASPRARLSRVFEFNLSQGDGTATTSATHILNSIAALIREANPDIVGIGSVYDYGIKLAYALKACGYEGVHDFWGPGTHRDGRVFLETYGVEGPL
jgi:hypothetical protein